MNAEFWDKRAKKYDDAIRKHDAVYHRMIASARSLLLASDVVLDPGCASGEYSLDVAPFVERVHGIDTSANMIALAAKKARDASVSNVTFDRADVLDRSPDAHGYAAVLALGFLHLLEDTRSVLRRVNELLPAGGLFISETPCSGEKGFLFKRLVGSSPGSGKLRAEGASQ